MKFLVFVCLLVAGAYADICPIESTMSMKGQTQTLLTPTTVDCGSAGCVEINTQMQSMGITTHSKTCMSLARLNTKFPMSDDVILDFNKCNSAYTAKVRNPQTSQAIDISVDLRCSKPISPRPTGPFCQVASSSSFNDKQQVDIAPTQIECPTGKCYQANTIITSRGQTFKSTEMNCMAFAQIEAASGSAGGPPNLIDFSKCNTRYFAPVTIPDTNDRVNADVDLKCFPTA